MEKIINLDFVGTNEDDELIIGSDEDDTFTVTKGNDKFKGGEGEDTVIIPSSDAMVIRGVDATGDYTGIKGEKFLYIRLKENGSFLNNFTIAYEVEWLKFQDTEMSLNIQIFNSTNFFNLSTKKINNFIVEDNLEEKITLTDHFFSFNEGNNITYAIDISKKSLEDQITVEGQEIIFKSGNSGPKIKSNITVTATETSFNNDLNDNNSISLNFEIQMTDDDYHPYFSQFKIEEKSTLEPFNSETIKGTLNYSESNDIIVITGGAETERGSYGDDIYVVSDLIPFNSNISIIDNFGSNKIQFPDNTFFSKAIFTQDAVRLTLSNSKVVTINNADKFTFNLGANITSGDISEDLDYNEFASNFEITDVLNLSQSVESTIFDVYLI